MHRTGTCTTAMGETLIEMLTASNWRDLFTFLLQMRELATKQTTGHTIGVFQSFINVDWLSFFKFIKRRVKGNLKDRFSCRQRWLHRRSVRSGRFCTVPSKLARVQQRAPNLWFRT